MRYLRMMLRFLMAVAMTYAVPSWAAAWEDSNGPHSTTVVGDTGPENSYSVYRPQTLRSNAHPVAVFCVGAGSHPKNWDALLTSLASHGVIVIASTDPYQFDGVKASAGVNWLMQQNATSQSDYHQKIIPSKVLAIGHSAGGNGAVLASIKNSNITSLLLYAPALDLANASDVLVPTFYIAGSLDTTVPPNFVKARYQDTSKAPAWYGEANNQSHIGFARNPAVQYYTRAWVYTQLLNDSGTARESFFGPDWTFKNASTWRDQLKNNSEQ